MNKKKITLYIIISLCLFTSCSKKVNTDSIYDEIAQNNEQIKELSEQNNRLKDKNEELKEELEYDKHTRKGTVNMIKQYIWEFEYVLNELSDIIPKLEYESELEKEQLQFLFSWIRENEILEENEILITLGPVIKADREGVYIVESCFYELQSTDDLFKEEYPRPIGKSYINGILFELRNENGTWKVKQLDI